MTTDPILLTQTLKKYFGYDSFRAGQLELIQAILRGQDTLGIMPTGAGKSICFQVPALVLSGITLVISPLISLMQDQVGALVQAGVPVAYINSSLTPRQLDTVYFRARQGAYKIIYVAPERLLAPDFLSFAQHVEISMVTVDEAHSISQWGQDFRPSYTKIPEFITHLDKRPLVSAFTATATNRVRQDIIEQLQQRDPHTLVTGFDRPNLYFSVQSPSDKMGALRTFLSTHTEKSGIIYCSTRKTVESVCDTLCKLGLTATRYHAGLSAEERQRNQEDFQFDRKQIMVATNAFGMGIDKANVAFVVHYNMPRDMESYYQEAGRAGRDGSPAECLLLFASQDIVTGRWMIEQSYKENEMEEAQREHLRQQDIRRLNHMANYGQSTSCLRNYILQYFGETPDKPCASCGNCNTIFAERDITVDAQKIFSCLYRMKRPFGVTMLLDVLRGKDNEKVRQQGFHQLSTFGICTQSAQGLRAIVEYLIVKGFILRGEGEYPTLRLAETARPVLKGAQTLRMPYIEKAPKPEKKRATNSTSADLPADRLPLYHMLRERRAQLAQQNKVPNYVIFADRVLVQMCLDLPRNDAQFLMLSGVGEAKLKSYGALFLEDIATFLQSENTVLSTQEVDRACLKGPKAPETLTLPNQKICDLLHPFDEGVSLSDLCRGLNEVLLENGCSKLIPVRVSAWLTEKGYLHLTSAEKGRSRVPTDQGRALGISQQMRTGREGGYAINLYDIPAQQYLCDHVREILEATQ